MPSTMKALSPSIRLFVIIPALLLAGFATSCKTTSRSTTVQTRAFNIAQANLMEADSLQGFAVIPGTKAFLRAIFSADSLHIEIKTSDTLTLRSMLVNGLSVWLDPKGKKNENFGIAFPAARSEMLRRQEELMREMREGGDTIMRPMRFEHRQWTDVVSQRQAVITDDKGTRFATRESASVFMNDNYELVYQVRFAFSQLGTTALDFKSLSVGVVSQLHQAVAQGPQSGGMATRPDISDRNRQPQQRPPQQRPMRMMLIPVNGWILVVLSGDITTAMPSGKTVDDPVYAPR